MMTEKDPGTIESCQSQSMSGFMSRSDLALAMGSVLPIMRTLNLPILARTFESEAHHSHSVLQFTRVDDETA